MKTFLTEKHNIPEGATHYANEAESRYFSWFKFEDGSWFIRILSDEAWFKCKNDEQKDSDLEAIPSAPKETPEDKPLDVIEQVEWENGDELYHINGEGDWCKLKGRYVAYDNKTSQHVIETASCGIFFADSEHIKKPETPEQRKEREELEAAYDLYCDLAYVNGATSFDAFKTDKKLVDFWLRVVRKTGYRVGE